MRRLEEQILTEKYRRIEGKLTLAELSVAPGEAAEGAFTIFASQEEIPAQGYVLTKDERMECKTEWFNGVQEKIVYRFCADGLQEGDSLQGQFLIVSDYGEYTLPWKVTRGGSRNCRKSLDACRIYRACAHGLENGGTVFLQQTVCRNL